MDIQGETSLERPSATTLSGMGKKKRMSVRAQRANDMRLSRGESSHRHSSAHSQEVMQVQLPKAIGAPYQKQMQETTTLSGSPSKFIHPTAPSPNGRVSRLSEELSADAELKKSEVRVAKILQTHTSGLKATGATTE